MHVYLRQYEHYSGKPAKNFADIGGGAGYYALAAQEQEVTSFLLDYANDALEFSKKTLKIENIVEGEVDNAHMYLPHERFEYVLLRHVIEHVVDPISCIANLAAIIKPGGILQIETPNVDSLEQLGRPHIIAANYRALRSSNPAASSTQVARWSVSKSLSGINPPKHLWGFTQQGISQILDKTGYEILSIQKKPFGDSIYDPLYFDYYSRANRSALGELYYFAERATTVLFKNSGSNLIVHARKK